MTTSGSTPASSGPTEARRRDARPRFARAARAALAALLFVSAAPIGCAGTETGNPPATDGAVEVGVFPPPADFAPPDEVDVAVIERAGELGEVYLSLARIELVPAGSCEALRDDQGVFVAETIEVEIPSTGTFDLPAGTYCALRLWPTIAADAPEVPALLRGHSFAVRLVDGAGDPYVTVESDRTAPVVLFAADPGFTLVEGGTTVTLLVDAVGALVAREFWMQPGEPDGSWVFDEEGDAEFLRLLETSDALFRLFLGAELDGQPAPDGGATGGASGGGSGGGGGSGDMLGPQLAASGGTP